MYTYIILVPKIHQIASDVRGIYNPIKIFYEQKWVKEK